MSSTGNAGSSIDQARENIWDRIQINDDRIKERAKQIALKAFDTMPARQKKACTAGALYIACQEAGLPIGLKDIEAIANGLCRKDIVHAKAWILDNVIFDVDLPPFDDTPYVDRFCTVLGLGNKEKKAAEDAFANLQKIENRHSSRLKAAAIAHLMQMIATKNSISEFRADLFIEIGDVAKLEPATIRDFYKKKVFPRLSEIVPALNDMGEAASASEVETTTVAHDPTMANRSGS